MTTCTTCATELSPEVGQCPLCGAYVHEVSADPEISNSKHARVAEFGMLFGMLMVAVAAIALILHILAPGEIRISLWLADVLVDTSVPVYVAGAVGAILIVVGYGSRWLER